VNGGATVTGSTTPKQVDSAGAFSKSQAGTLLRLTWEGTIGLSTNSPPAVCQFFLKVDSQQGAVMSTVTLPTEAFVASPVTLIDFFSGLAAGSHAITIWAVAPVAHRAASATSAA
jgi:hypothetical protein